MKPSIELFKLIKSLSKSEKRFFKLSSSLQSGDKNYLKIFDEIEKQEEYDEESLKEVFKNERFVHHLPSEKNHLYRLILKSLRSFYSEHSVSSQLKQELKNVEILYNKALYKECEKFVSRAKELAASYEKFYYWYELISWQKKLLEEALDKGELASNLNDLVAEEEMVISKLRNLAEYQVIYSKINLVFRSGGFTRNEEEKQIVYGIADYHLIKGKNTAISTKAASICYYIKGLCAATVRNYSDSFQFFNRTKEILDNNPKIKMDSQQRYVMTLFHLLRCYIDYKDFENARLMIEELYQLTEQKGFDTTDHKVRIFSNTRNLELSLNHVQGDFETAVGLIPLIKEGIDLYQEKISKEQCVKFSYNIAYSYFGIGEYKKALNELNEVLNDNERFLRQDIYSFSRMLNLVLHFELENYDFLEYVIKSTNRYLSKHERDYKVEDVFVKYIRKLSKASSTAVQLEIFQKMEEEMTVLMQDHQERIVLEFFNLPAWINSKIDRITFPESVKKELKRELNTKD